MIIIIYFVVLILFFVFGVSLLYRLSASGRYRIAVRMWLGTFLLELGGLLGVKTYRVPWLGMTFRNSFNYLIDLLFNSEETVTKLVHGQYPDLALLLLLPCLAALVGFWYDRRRQRAAK
jgi:hypothetical protein